MPSGFPEHVEPPPQSVADVERSQYRAAWQEAMKIELGTLEITQKAFIESMLNRFGVDSSSDIPATPGVELGPREEGEPGGDWPYREAVGSLM